MAFTRICIGALVVMLVFGTQTLNTSSQQARTPNLVIEHSLAVATGAAQSRGHEQHLSGGVMDAVLQSRLGQTLGPAAAAVSAAPVQVRLRTNGCSNTFSGPFPNIRVNQDCSLRRQAEEQIAIDPTNSNHLIAGQNDSRIGFNHCGIDFSFDRGLHWGDMLPPFSQFLLKDFHTADAASDPAIAFDSRGNAYFSCIVFDVASAANAVLVTKSNAAFGGTFFHTPKPGPFQALSDNPPGVVANDNDPTIFNDKEFMAADSNTGSPKRDNVYVTWTRFRSDANTGGTIESPIVFSQSTDGGATWSARVEISGRSTACVGGNLFDASLPPDKCNQDQGSWPVVGPNGTLYVFFNNGNTSSTNPPTTIVAQHMMVKCLGTADCTNAANWSKPVMIAEDFDTQPFTTLNGCPVDNRQCLPPNGYRLNDFGAGAIDPRNGRLYFAWSDFRNGGPCAGTPVHPVPPCANYNNDVFIVSSRDGGTSWSEPTLVSNDDHTKAAQWQAWMAVGANGTVYVAYYDRQYGCEATGCNDITLAVSNSDNQSDDENGGLTFSHTRITTSSMPNLVPGNNPVQAGFLGDYMSVTADSRGALLVWADTRSFLTAVPEEDIYFASFPR